MISAAKTFLKYK